MRCDVEDDDDDNDDNGNRLSIPTTPVTSRFLSFCISTSLRARWRTLLAVVPACPTSASCKASKDRHAEISTGDTSSFADTWRPG